MQYSRIALRTEASSEIRSAIMSRAPLMASSAVSTPFSSSMNSKASASGSPLLLSCSKITSANGSRPFSFATVALVRRFCLYGRYMSSSSARMVALSIAFSSSSVIFPCSSMSLYISCLRVSKPRRYEYRSERDRNVWSSTDPVSSLR